MTPPAHCASSALRIVVYTDAMGIGGAEISLGHLVAHVLSDIAITVVGVSQRVVDAIAVQRPQTQGLVLPATGIQSLLAHLTTFHQLQPDVVHFNLCTPWACASGLVAALSLPNARVVRVDQLPLRTTGAIELWRTRALSLRVDAHVAVGEASARRMEDFYALGRHTVLSVPNGVPAEVSHPYMPVKQHDGLLIGSVGRLDAMKAHDVLLRAIAQVDNVQVEILGEGEQRTTLEALAVELGIHDRVSLPGWIEQPRERLHQYDLFVLPSRSEGFPLAIVEAMLAARPVIATRVGSIAEAVIPDETGILIEKDDVAGLVSALCRLRDDAALRERLGQQGQALANARFTALQMAKRYEEIWQKVVSMPRSPRLYVPRPCD
ncbi:glycosyltransferase [Leptolyngbya sp. FACHB-321]|uniref:glycosyltransferase n=1 Tax=Leptolyngbya sp. FACHB-321 TaxID=2692807 RepID=UPI001687958F|nr:glycosyltransferase [Leptolyngbya sp. FACHB-321]MBD2034637.1 glycosyltransferase [Leptolyngbya sp. FACHB-321]